MPKCCVPLCTNYSLGASLYCAHHGVYKVLQDKKDERKQPSLALTYPKYYKALPEGWTVVDTYAVNILFPLDDPSGCLLHARKKLLVPGVRSGGKSMRKDVQEARDTLNRWLELNPE